MPQIQERALATDSDNTLEPLISEYKTFSNRRVIKNLVVLSVGCLLAFCAYDGLVMLQSTLNQDGGIGVISVAVQFGFSCITALLLPEYLFEKMGCRSVIAICLLLFVPYIASNFYPHWSLMIPASILIGLANSLYWAAQSAYLNHLSILYTWNLNRNKMVASNGNCRGRPKPAENMGGRVVDTNAPVLNECEHDRTRALNKEVEKIGGQVADTNAPVLNECEHDRTRALNKELEKIGGQVADTNAPVLNECEHDRTRALNKEVEKIGGQVADTNAPVLNECEHDRTRALNKEVEKIGGQVADTNAPVLNECEHDRTRALNKELEKIGGQVADTNAPVLNECEHDRTRALNKELEKIGGQVADTNAPVLNECQHDRTGALNKELEKIGGQVVDTNAPVLNEYEDDRTRALNKEVENIGGQVVDTNAPVLNEYEEDRTRALNKEVEKIGGQVVDKNAPVLNEYEDNRTRALNNLNKELEKTLTQTDFIEESSEKKALQGINDLRSDKDFVKTFTLPSVKPVTAKPDRKVSEMLASTTARFFGIHGLIYQTCHVWGNLLSYYVLRIGAVAEDLDAHNTICRCGIDFCNAQTNCSTNNLREPREDLRNLLTGVFVAISALSVVFVLFGLDELKNKKKNVTISWKYIAATCKQIKDTRQLLLIPMSLNIGVMQGFVMGDFTKDYVACAWGVHHVGLVTACLGATLALSSSLSGCLVKHVGRRTVFLVAEGVNIAAVVAMYLWKPTSSETFMFFVISGMLGAVLGTFWSQLRAFYGVLFKQKEGAAFANYQLWHAIGMAMTFAYSSFLCTSVKIYIYTAFSSAGMVGYLLAEHLHSSDS